MVTIHRILCPIDFSEFSRHALLRAAALAKAHGGAITAVHVVPIQPRLTPFPMEIHVPASFELTPHDRQRLERELSAFVQLEPALAVPVDTDVIEAPTVEGEILIQAERLHADLIVMGTHGRSGFQRLILGSVTEKVLRTAPQPVLTVGAVSDAAVSPAFKRILCGIDFSECSLAALDFALTLAGESDAHVTAVNVVEWVPLGYDPLVGPPTDLVGYRMAAEASSKERLHNAVAAAHPHGPVEEIVTSGKPHRELLRIAAEHACDLIVLGIHGRNPIDRMLFGSTAEPVVRRAVCPVLTVRAHADASAAAA